MTNALLLVDLQNDFCEGGTLPIEGGADTVRRINDFLCESEKLYDYIVASMDWHINPGSHFSDEPDYIDSWPRHCVADSNGAQFHPNLTEKALIEEIFFKGGYEAAYSAFEGEGFWHQDLDSWLKDREVTEIDVVGLAFDYCVKASALDAARFGYKTTVISELTESVHQDLGYLFNVLDEFNRGGVNVV